MTDLVRAGSAYARVHHSRWIVDCPDALNCGSALQMDPGEREFRCWDCGTEAEVVWPANVVDIEELLSWRPGRRNRNWNRGETLHDLLQENAIHGIAPPMGRAVEGQPVFAITGDRITLGALTSTTRTAIGA